jgi:UDP-N-acetylglucosamine 2-epimerase (non-hydrolysing)
MKLIVVVGARPNFIKVAPLFSAIGSHNIQNKTLTLEPILVHTGQHYDYEMSQVFFEDLELPKPDIHLGVGSGTHAEQTGKIMVGFEKVLVDKRPDLVIVVGDVNSTLAAALAAVKLHIPIAHVEAGLRSYDKTMPEEINRLLTDHISDYLFTTSKYDDENLKKEGIPPERIFRVGNIMVDSLLHCKDIAARRNTLTRLGLERKGYALLTLHRPSNVDDEQSLTHIFTAVNEIAPRIPIIFPAHPRTQKSLKEFGLLDKCKSLITSHQLLITSPLGYLDFLNLEMNSRFVITDSGGIQVETTVLGIPCLTVLDSPIWTITHKQGTNTLVGSNGQKLEEEALKILNSKSKSESKSPTFWDGRAAERIVEILTKKTI